MVAELQEVCKVVKLGAGLEVCMEVKLEAALVVCKVVMVLEVYKKVEMWVVCMVVR